MNVQLKLIKNLDRAFSRTSNANIADGEIATRLKDCVSNNAAYVLNWRCCLLACWFKLRTLTLLPCGTSALPTIRPLPNLSLLIGIETYW